MENLQTEKSLLIWKEDDLIKDQWILQDTGEQIVLGLRSVILVFRCAGFRGSTPFCAIRIGNLCWKMPAAKTASLSMGSGCSNRGRWQMEIPSS